MRELLKDDELGAALLEWIGDEDRAHLVNSAAERGPDDPAALITVGDDGVTFKIGIIEASGCAFLLSHDIGHFLAADDTDLRQPNLGLTMGANDEAAVSNEELTLAYQSALLGVICPAVQPRMVMAIKILKTFCGVKRKRVDALAAHMSPELIRAEWKRKLDLVLMTELLPS